MRVVISSYIGSLRRVKKGLPRWVSALWVAVKKCPILPSAGPFLGPVFDGVGYVRAFWSVLFCVHKIFLLSLPGGIRRAALLVAGAFTNV